MILIRLYNLMHKIITPDRDLNREAAPRIMPPAVLVGWPYL